MQNERIIVTGSAGFIGGHLTQSLLARGATVLGIDNFDPFYDRAIKESNQTANRDAADASSGTYDFADLDIASPGAFSAAAERFRPTGIIHLAAKAGVRPSIEDREEASDADDISVAEQRPSG